MYIHSTTSTTTITIITIIATTNTVFLLKHQTPVSVYWNLVVSGLSRILLFLAVINFTFLF